MPRRGRCLSLTFVAAGSPAQLCGRHVLTYYCLLSQQCTSARHVSGGGGADLASSQSPSGRCPICC